MRLLRSQITQVKAELDNQNKYVQQLKTIEQMMEEQKELVSKVDSALPSGPDTPSLLKLLDEISTQTGVTLEGINLQQGAVGQGGEQEKVKVYSLGLNISGSYFAFKNFLFALERSARLVDVTQTDFSIRQESDTASVFRVFVKFYSY
jgi:Tfp pilus assembly protein PilO